MPAAIRGLKLFFLSFAIGLGTLLISLDTFIANVSIPTISGDLGVSPDQGSWVITSFTVANAVVVPLTGWLTLMFGRVRLFAFSTIAFSIMSFFCGISFTLPMLLVSRFFQGLCSGCLIPLSQTLLLHIYPPDKKGLAIGLWGLVAMVGPVLGPFLGGWITDNYGWGWIFYINVPLGILAGGATYILLRDHESERKRPRLDLIGLSFFATGIISLQVMVDRGNDLDWFGSPMIITLGIISLICLTVFVIWEIYEDQPVIDLSLFKNWNFTTGTLTAAFAMMVIFSSLIIEPLWTQAQLGYTPLWSGLTLAPFGVFAVILFPLLGLFLHRVDMRIPLVISTIIFMVTFYHMSQLYPQASYESIALPRLWQGIGFAFLFVPLTAITLSHLPEERIASGAGIFSFMRMLFIGIGVSLAITFWQRRSQFYQSRLTEYVIPSNQAYGEYYQDLSAQGIVGQQANAFVYQEVSNQAFTFSMLDYFHGAMVIFMFLFLVCFTFKISKKAKVIMTE
jgi:DHA2 family multidrug resistance protein